MPVATRRRFQVRFGSQNGAALGFICAVTMCGAAYAATAGAAVDTIRLAQADDQPATAPPASPTSPKPAKKPERKPAPKPQLAAPAKTAPAAAAPAAAPAASQSPARAASAEPAPPKPPPSEAAEPQPLVHASQAGAKSCLDGIARAANGTIDTQHAAMSQWFTGAADSHVFESIVSLTYPNKVAPRAAAILLAAPTQAQNCDTSTVQIFPTARPCNLVLADLLKEGKVIADLAGAPVTQSPNGARQILMPTAGNGCVMVVVTLTFGK